MEKTKLHTNETKKSWEAPTLIEIDKSKILGGNDPGNDGNVHATPGAASPGPLT